MDQIRHFLCYPPIVCSLWPNGMILILISSTGWFVGIYISRHIYYFCFIFIILLKEKLLMTYKIALVTDSTNDLPAEFREKYEIYVVPLTIIWGGKQYLDGSSYSWRFLFQIIHWPRNSNDISAYPKNLLANIKKRSKWCWRNYGHYHQQCHERYFRFRAYRRRRI